MRRPKHNIEETLNEFYKDGLVLSTDDYFSQDNGYLYDPSLLGKAHHWNQIRAKEAMYKCCSPVIIDNTNLQAWEMKPYVKLAMETGYSIHFHEPHTSWKFDPMELEKRNKHGVPRKKIGQMLERFELPMSLDIVMNSQEPPRGGSQWMRQRRLATIHQIR
uniref:NEDD4-binding protein 2-like 2 n=1 Tax=Esox lucius TaxID=8010 RepID=A0AAY5KQH1_ESOLU